MMEKAQLQSTKQLGWISLMWVVILCAQLPLGQLLLSVHVNALEEKGVKRVDNRRLTKNTGKFEVIVIFNIFGFLLEIPRKKIIK
jgi:hypothetical protein